MKDYKGIMYVLGVLKVRIRVSLQLTWIFNKF